MDRRSLEFFRAVADTGSVSEASRSMLVTQPAVSKQISRLESSLNLKLFHRTSAGMALTAAGKTLYDLGGDVLTRFERIEETLKTRFRGSPALRVASPHTTATVLLTPFMADTNPPIVDLLIVSAPELDPLLGGDADMAISSLRPPPRRRQMIVAPLTIEVQGTPRAMQEVFGDAPVADLEKLGERGIIAPRTGVHVVAEEATVALTTPLPVRSVSAGSVAQALAANNHGFALVTEKEGYGLDGRPAHVEGKPLISTLYASWDTQHYAAAELHRLAQSFSHWMSTTPPWSFHAPEHTCATTGQQLSAPASPSGNTGRA